MLNGETDFDDMEGEEPEELDKDLADEFDDDEWDEELEEEEWDEFEDLNEFEDDPAPRHLRDSDW